MNTPTSTLGGSHPQPAPGPQLTGSQTQGPALAATCCASHTGVPRKALGCVSSAQLCRWLVMWPQASYAPRSGAGASPLDDGLAGFNAKRSSGDSKMLPTRLNHRIVFRKHRVPLMTDTPAETSQRLFLPHLSGGTWMPAEPTGSFFCEPGGSCSQRLEQETLLLCRGATHRAPRVPARAPSGQV